MKLRASAYVVALVFAACSAAQAQTSTGKIVGTVQDPSGAAITNAKLDAKNVDTDVVTSAQTNGSGEYQLNNLLAGTYALTASAAGFADAGENVAVVANQTATANFSLSVGAVSTSIEVSSAVALIDTTTATIQNSFDTALARDLPVSTIGLGPANLSLLNAGVGSNGGIGAGEGPSIGGQRPRNNNFMVEGTDANNKVATGSLIRYFPNDAIAEFAVLQNQAGAEYGHSSGGQFNVILKSGTNSFHGTLSEYLENRDLTAVDQQQANSNVASGLPASFNPRYDNNRFGGTLGGPIIKDKLFFFSLFEYDPVGAPSTPSGLEAPTGAGYSLLSTIPGVNQTNLGILQKYVPAASTAVAADAVTVGGTTIPVGPIGVTAPLYQNNYAFVQTVDFNVSSRDQIRGRYIYNRLSQINIGTDLSAFFTFNINTYHVANIGEYHTFSPSLTNEFRLGYNRLNQPKSAGDFRFPGLDQFPNIVFNDLGIDIGPPDNSPQEDIQNTYQIQDNVNWVKGAHTLQFGFDGRRYISPETFTQLSRGYYQYKELSQYLFDLTPDYVATRSLGNPVYYGDQVQTFEYAQDSWRIRPNLTVNLGVRYELTTVPQGERTQILNSIADVPGVFTFGVPQSQKKNFAPRIGLAYSPGSKGTTSIRAGFGMAYDVIFDNIGILDLPPELSTTSQQTCTAALPADCPGNFLKNGGILPNTAVSNSLTPTRARMNTAAWIPNQVLPYSINWNIGIQHVFANNYTLDVRYLGTRGVHLDLQDRPTVQSVVTPANSLPTYLSMPSQAVLNSLPLTLNQLQAEASGTGNILPLYANAGFTNPALIVNEPFGWSTYNGLAVQLNRHFTNNLQFQTAYTWSHLIDNSTADINTTALTPRRPEDFQNLSIEKATSALDRRQRFTLAMYYDAPWFRNRKWLMKNVLGNWTIAPVFTYESPELATVQSALDANLNGDSATDRVIINPSGVAGTGSGVTALKNSAGQIVAYLANNPNARYIAAGSGSYANGGRNTLPLRPIDNLDLSVFKNISFSERYRLQFGAQFFNALNHPQFVPGLVDRVNNPAVLNNSAVDQSLLTPGKSIFNNPEAVFSSNPRLIQVSAKLFF